MQQHILIREQVFMLDAWAQYSLSLYLYLSLESIPTIDDIGMLLV